MNSAKHIVILGTSFAGYTAAIELRHKLGREHRITVVSPTPRFLFIPSLIWVPFGLREEDDISFDVREQYLKRGIDFQLAAAETIDLRNQTVGLCNDQSLHYDYLLICTGPKLDWDSIPGIGPQRFSHSIATLPDARKARAAWQEFLQKPGPMIVGATQGAACFGAAYEFILNARYQLSKNGVRDQHPLTFVTAEPFLSHFGIGGFGPGKWMCEQLFRTYNIEWRTNATIREVAADAVVLGSGERLESGFTMLMPRFLGVDVVRNTPGLGNAAGFIETTDGYRHREFANVYAAGIAVHVPPPGETEVPCGVPKTGYPSEQMAKTAVHNIVVDVTGEGEMHNLPFGEMKALCVMDTGNMGMMILGDHMLPPRQHEVIVPGPQAHWSKIVFEKHYLASRKRGIV
jgi:sulfide:quinone oxidoreductase